MPGNELVFAYLVSDKMSVCLQPSGDKLYLDLSENGSELMRVPVAGEFTLSVKKVLSEDNRGLLVRVWSDQHCDDDLPAEVFAYMRQLAREEAKLAELKKQESEKRKQEAARVKMEVDLARDLCLKQELVQLIRREPKHARSYYERLPVKQGGIKASQDRKERAVNEMISSGVLQIMKLERPVGRATHYLSVNESVLKSEGLPSAGQGV